MHNNVTATEAAASLYDLRFSLDAAFEPRILIGWFSYWCRVFVLCWLMQPRSRWATGLRGY